MRIAQVCPYSLSVPGGVQVQVLGLARALRALGHEARVLGPCDGPPPDSMVTPLGKSVPMAVNGSMAPIAPDPACVLRTIHSLNNEDFDILHLHEPVVPGPTLTSLIVARTPMVGTFHASGERMAYSHFPWAARKVARKLRARVAVSNDARISAQLSVGGDFDVLFNGIEIERFSQARPYPTKGPTIVFVGRHEHRKGLAVLLAAMKKLPKDVTLWVIGHGPQTSVLKAETVGDERIEWLGRVSDEEKARRLAGADVFCAPSVEGESFGIVLLEAMAAKTPVVASDLAGYRNVARANIDALLVAPNDSGALAVAIDRVLNESGLASTMVEAGTGRAEQFSMRHLAEAYLEVYDRARSRYPFVV